MANSKETARQGGVGFPGLLCVLFVGLKLTGVIDWSWWWVTAPIWGPLAAVLTFVVAALIFEAIAALIGSARKR